MNAILAIIKKELTLFRRDRVALLMTFIFPLVVGEFFGFVFSRGDGPSKPKEMLVIAVDEDQTLGSTAFIEFLDESPDIKIELAATYDDARATVLGRNALAYVRLSKGFELAQSDMFTHGRGPTIELGVDPARQAETGWVQGIIQERAYRSMSQSFGDPAKLNKQLTIARDSLRSSTNVDPGTRAKLEQLFSNVESLGGSVKQLRTTESNTGKDDKASGGGVAFEPIHIDTVKVQLRDPKSKGPSNSRAITFPQGMFWGIMGCAMGFAGTLAGERTRGTLLRLYASPVPPSLVLLGKGLATAIVTMCVCWLLLGFAALAHNVYAYDYVMLFVATACVALAFMGIMMFAATIGSSEAATNRVGWFVMMGLAFIGGAAVPSMFFDGFLKTASYISPVKWTLDAIEGALWREFSWGQMLPVLGILVLIGTVGAGLGMAILRTRKPS